MNSPLIFSFVLSGVKINELPHLLFKLNKAKLHQIIQNQIDGSLQHTSSQYKTLMSNDQRTVNVSPLQVKAHNPYSANTTSQEGTHFPLAYREYVFHNQPPPITPSLGTSFYSQPPPLLFPIPLMKRAPVMLHKGLEGPPPPHKETHRTLNVTRPSLSHHRYVSNSRERTHNVKFSIHIRNDGNHYNKLSRELKIIPHTRKR